MSPLEERFWQIWEIVCPKVHLEREYIIRGADYEYRVDAAHLESLVIVELDGFAYHNNALQYQYDRRRDRNLSLAGWHVVRFASVDILVDPLRSIGELLQLIQMYSPEERRAQYDGPLTQCNWRGKGLRHWSIPYYEAMFELLGPLGRYQGKSAEELHIALVEELIRRAERNVDWTR